MSAWRKVRWVTVPAGEFAMGGSGGDRFVNRTELPVRMMKVAEFRMMECPVTEQLWAEFSGAGAGGELPVTGASWQDAQLFAAWLGAAAGGRCRLPDEVEWEYACRAGSRQPFSCGAMITTADANFLYDEGGMRVGPGARSPVGSYPANAFGLRDMHGNVCEWTADPWRRDHDSPPAAGRTIRGGAWDHLPRLLRCSWRDHAPEDERRDNLGFRLVME